MNRNLTIGLNILFSLVAVYVASQLMAARQPIPALLIASFVSLGVFMLSLLAALVQRIMFLKVMFFVNQLCAIFLVFRQGLGYLSAPSDSRLLFLVFVVLPFVINAILIRKMITVTGNTEGK